LSAEAVAIAVEMAKSSPNLAQNNIFFSRYNSTLSSIKGAPIRLSEDEKRFVMDESRSHLAYIKNTFGLDLPEPEDGSNVEVEPFGRDAVESFATQLRLLIDRDTQLADATSNELVREAYWWLLGREPESDEVICAQLRDSAGDRMSLRTNIMRSQEFARKVTKAVPPV
jgi:hypothetical protein